MEKKKKTMWCQIPINNCLVQIFFSFSLSHLLSWSDVPQKKSMYILILILILFFFHFFIVNPRHLSLKRVPWHDHIHHFLDWPWFGAWTPQTCTKPALNPNCRFRFETGPNLHPRCTSFQIHKVYSNITYIHILFPNLNKLTVSCVEQQSATEFKL